MHLSSTVSVFFRIAGSIAVFSLVIFGLADVGLAQTCDPPKIVANANSSNFFSAEQEMIVGELTLYSFDTGDKMADFIIKGDLTFARFSLDGKRLFLFSDSQTGYSIDLTKMK